MINSIVSRQSGLPVNRDPIANERPPNTCEAPPDPHDRMEFAGTCGKVLVLGSLPVVGAAVNAVSVLSGGLQTADVSLAPLAFGLTGTAANVASCVALCTGHPVLGCALAAVSGFSLLGEQLSLNSLFS